MSSNAIHPQDINNLDNVKVYDSSILSLERSKFNDLDLIVHLASPVGPVGVLRHSGKIGSMILNDLEWCVEVAKKNRCPLIFISTSEIYKRASFVIGSCSGGTHFPSLMFNIPTLYIADIPLWHFKAIYNLPESNYKNLSIPNKDKWLLISKEKFNSLTSTQYENILKKFFSEENISSMKEFNTYRCDKSDSKEEPAFTKDKKGNIHVSEFSFNTLGI